MQKRRKLASVFLVFILALAVGHLFLQITFFGTGISGFAERGISGRAVDGININGSGFSLSTLILIAEWGLLLLGLVFVYARHKIELKKEFESLSALKSKKHFVPGTELDNFYELLQDMKHFRLASAAKVFDVDDDVVDGWAKTLESQNVAVLTYPRIGGPEILLKNKEEKGGSNGAVQQR